MEGQVPKTATYLHICSCLVLKKIPVIKQISSAKYLHTFCIIYSLFLLSHVHMHLSTLEIEILLYQTYPRCSLHFHFICLLFPKCSVFSHSPFIRLAAHLLSSPSSYNLERIWYQRSISFIFQLLRKGFVKSVHSLFNQIFTF